MGKGEFMDKNEISVNINELRGKHTKTNAEQLVLEYRRSLLTISEILVSHNKGHISDEGLVEEIKVVLREVL